MERLASSIKVLYRLPGCPNCCSVRTVKNGCIHNGNNAFSTMSKVGSLLNTCIYKVICSTTRKLLDNLLLERSNRSPSQSDQAMATNQCSITCLVLPVIIYEFLGNLYL